MVTEEAGPQRNHWPVPWVCPHELNGISRLVVRVGTQCELEEAKRGHWLVGWIGVKDPRSRKFRVR